MLGDEKNLDVKDKADSSDAKAAIEDSATSKDQQPIDDKAPQSLTDFLKEKGVGEKEEDDTADVEQDADEKKVDDNSNPDSGLELDRKKKVDGEKEDPKDKEEEEEEEVEGEKKDDKDSTEVEEGKPVPYDRFKAVIEERNNFKNEVETYKTKATNFDSILSYCEKNNISSPEFQEMLRVQGLISSGKVEEGLKALLPVVESLQSLTGDRLPPDLQSKVDENKMELDDARELAKLRNRGKYDTALSQREKESQQRREQNEFQTRLNRASTEWESAKRVSDPDYKPKAKPELPDGMWELTKDKFLAGLNATDANGNYINPIGNEAQMVALLEKSYKAVKAVYTVIRKPVTSKRLSSNGSSSSSKNKTIESAGSMREAMEIAAAGRV